MKKQAIFSYDRCLPIKVETWDKVGEAQCLDNLGLAHYSAGELRLAAEYYEQSLSIWRAEGDKHALMLCYQRCPFINIDVFACVYLCVYEVDARHCVR